MGGTGGFVGGGEVKRKSRSFGCQGDGGALGGCGAEGAEGGVNSEVQALKALARAPLDKIGYIEM